MGLGGPGGFYNRPIAFAGRLQLALYRMLKSIQKQRFSYGLLYHFCKGWPLSKLKMQSFRPENLKLVVVLAPEPPTLQSFQREN